MSLAGDALNAFIERQIFFPDPFLVWTPAEVGLRYQDVWIDTSDRVRLHGWLVPAASSLGLFLFCHGNAGNISHRVDNIQRLHEIGFTVFIFDYRGYGNSEGRISEEGFYLDAEAAYRTARSFAERDNLKLIVFGRSLGGIAAVHIAAQVACAGVILESTFTHMGAMAREHFPLPGTERVLRSRLNSVDKIGRVKAPLLFFHGDLDVIVPLRLGQELFEAAPSPKEFVVIPGAGHNDTYLVAGKTYFDKLEAFAQGLP
jgi:uncharacterized protein